MAPGSWNRAGLVVLVVLAGACAIAAVLAYSGQGHMGIEERFSSALGLGSPGGDGPGEDTGAAGFAIEGDTMLYGIIVLALSGVAGIMYSRYRV